jgi:hypothetical protein
MLAQCVWWGTNNGFCSLWSLLTPPRYNMLCQRSDQSSADEAPDTARDVSCWDIALSQPMIQQIPCLSVYLVPAALSQLIMLGLCNRPVKQSLNILFSHCYKHTLLMLCIQWRNAILGHSSEHMQCVCYTDTCLSQTCFCKIYQVNNRHARVYTIVTVIPTLCLRTWKIMIIPPKQ